MTDGNRDALASLGNPAISRGHVPWDPWLCGPASRPGCHERIPRPNCQRRRQRRGSRLLPAVLTAT